MDYKKIYDALVEKAKVRGLDKRQHEGYFEIHHINPRCLGGGDEDSNLVMLTGREHYIAHMLLWKIHKGNRSLMHAAWMMSHLRNGDKVGSKLYHVLKEEHSEWLSERMSGENSPLYKDLTGIRNGKLLVVEQAGWEKLPSGFSVSVWRCICDCGNERVLASRFVSPDSKSAYKSCGCLISEMASKQVGELNPFFGRKHSEESKAKMAAKKMGKSPVNKGKPNSELTRQRIKDTLSKIVRFPWTHPTVQSDPIKVEIWLMADFYYELYLTNPDLTKAKFTTLYNSLYNDNLISTALYTLHDKFRGGWVPSEDENWLSFKNNMLEC